MLSRPTLVAALTAALVALPTAARAQAAADSAYRLAQQAASSSEAEQAWLRFVVEWPAHPRTGEALYELARLELARGDRERAAGHLERAVRDYPASPRRAASALALAKLRIDARDVAAGCDALGEARTAVSAEDAELRNQIEYYERRCASERAAAVAAREETAPTATERSRATKSSGATSQRGGTPAGREVSEASTSKAQSAKPKAKPPAPKGRFTIQVAAFNTRDDAESLAEVLKHRELEARIIGSKKPFRVRVGRYATRAEATAALARLKSRKVTSSGFVTEAEKP